MVQLEPSKVGVYSINGISIFEKDIEEYIFNFEKTENRYRTMIIDAHSGRTPLLLESMHSDTKAVLCFSLCARILVATLKNEIGSDLNLTPAENLLSRHFPEYLNQKYLTDISLNSEQITLINQKAQRFREALINNGFAEKEVSKNDSPLSVSLDRIIGSVVDRFAHRANPDSVLNVELKPLKRN